MKVTIITYAHQRPDFIAMQHESIKKYVKDDDVEFIVYNNSVDKEGLRNQITESCNDLGIRCIDVILEQDGQKQGGCFTGKSYASGQLACSYPLNWSWNDICDTGGLICIIDSDMFFVKDININDMMSDHDIAFIPQYRAEFRTFYMWNGLVLLNMDTLPNPKEINWSPGLVNGDSTDVGGYTHYYFQKYMSQMKIMFLEFWGLMDYDIEENEKRIEASLNGNITYDIVVDNGLISSFDARDIRISDLRSFPYETERSDYAEYITRQFEKFHEYLVDNDFDLPKPLYVDLIKIQDTDVNDSFVLHYKSGSNYLPFQSGGYNIKKTEEVKKILDLGLI